MPLTMHPSQHGTREVGPDRSPVTTRRAGASAPDHAAPTRWAVPERVAAARLSAADQNRTW